MPLFGPPNVEKLKAKGKVDGLIKALGYEKDIDICCQAAAALGEIGDPSAVESLIGLLKDSSNRKSSAAINALAKIGRPAIPSLIIELGGRWGKEAANALHLMGWTPGQDEVGARYWVYMGKFKRCAAIGAPAVVPLTDFLKDVRENTKVREAAAAALGEIGDARAVDPLVAAIQNPKVHSMVRWTAAEALGAIGDARAVAPLVTALRDENRTVRRTAVKALGTIGDARAVGPLIDLLQNLEKDNLVSWVAAKAHQRDAAIADRMVREAAASALGEIGDVRAVGPLVSALQDKGQSVRGNAARALAKIGDVRAVDPLIAALDDEEKTVRHAAVSALGEIGDVRAVGPLIAAFDDEDWVRHLALKALVPFGPLAVDPLTAALEDASGSVREAAARALGEIGETRTVPSLIAALDDAEEEVRHATVEALGKIGPLAVDPLTAALEDSSSKVREAAARALGEIGDTRVVPSLIAALDDAEEEVRRAAVGAMGQLGDSRAVEPLIATLGDAAAKSEAAQALDRLNWQPPADETGARYWVAKGEFEKCVEIGVPALVIALTEGDSRMRDGASEALVQIGAPAVPLLLAVTQDERWWMRRDVVRLLGQIGDTRATESLITALADKTPDVSQAAVEALGQVGGVAVVELLNPARTIHSAVAALKGHSRSVRQAAAKVLIELYTSGRVPPKQKQLVLDQQAKIMERHTDRSDHTDYGKDCAPFDSHTDTQKHTDRGIGMDFPL